MADETTIPEYEGWAILELMGHRRLAGFVAEVRIAGAPVLRLNVVQHRLATGVSIALQCGGTFRIDTADAPLVTRWLWTANAKGYVMRRAAGRCIYLHRLLMEPPPNRVVDHENGDPRDNRRGNLRVCTHAENIRNQRHRAGGTSKWRGVFWDRGRSRWIARVKCDYRTRQLGSFESETHAAMAYDVGAFTRFGKFARLNFPSVRLIPGRDIYCLTPCSEEAAREVAGLGRVAPVQRWELPERSEAEVFDG